jgi:hypothetical protein
LVRGGEEGRDLKERLRGDLELTAVHLLDDEILFQGGKGGKKRIREGI